MEGDLGQLMGLAPVEQHILAGGGGIAEAIADVEAEIHTTHQTGGAAPVPGVVIGPHATAPVQNAEAVLGGEGVAVRANGHGAVGPHTVDLLVVVEVGFLFKGGADDHGFFRLPQQRYLDVNWLLAPEIIHVGRQDPLAPGHHEFHGIAGAADLGNTGAGAFGQAGLAHGEDPHGAFGDLPGGALERQEGDGVQTHVAVVGDGQGDAVAVVAHIIVIPFLQPCPAALDLGPVIDGQQPLGVAGFGQVAFFVQQRDDFCDLVLHKDTSMMFFFYYIMEFEIWKQEKHRNPKISVLDSLYRNV